MVKADWFGKEEYRFSRDSSIVFQGTELYINGVKIELEKHILQEIKKAQELVEKIAEIISRSDTAVFYLPEGFEMVAAYSTDFSSEVEIYELYSDGDNYSNSISEIVAIDGNERYRLTFNPNFPVPETIHDALIGAVSEDRTFVFGKRGEGNEKDRI